MNLLNRIEKDIKRYELYWILFSDMLTQNAPLYYFIHTIISTNRDLNKGLLKVLDSKVCVLPIIRTALENMLICYQAYILKDTKLDTFTRRYVNGQKLSAITISLPPELYNKAIKHPEEKDATGSTEVQLTNSTLTKLVSLSSPSIRNIYLECCANIHPTREQYLYSISQTGYIGDKSEYPELTLSDENKDKYLGWMIEVNELMLSLLESWTKYYHHLPFNPEVNGTKEVVDDVNEILPLEEQSEEELIANVEQMIESTSSESLKELLSDFIKQKKDTTI